MELFNKIMHKIYRNCQKKRTFFKKVKKLLKSSKTAKNQAI